MKRFLPLLLALGLLILPVGALEPCPTDALTLSADSALLMEKSTGTILYEKDAYATGRRPPSPRS